MAPKVLQWNIAELQIEPNEHHLLKNLEGYIREAVCLADCRHAGNSSDVTLAFEERGYRDCPENVCFNSEAFSACVANRHSLNYWPTHHRWVGNIVITESDGV